MPVKLFAIVNKTFFLFLNIEEKCTYDMLGPVETTGIFCWISLMSLDTSTEFQVCNVIFAKFAVITQIRLVSVTASFFIASTVHVLHEEKLISINYLLQTF